MKSEELLTKGDDQVLHRAQKQNLSQELIGVKGLQEQMQLVHCLELGQPVQISSVEPFCIGS
ncbi:hypothetical protein ELQ35_20850 [Peribacillus cavernae]|uniref:Uncharacterized protein n=1 Tax=Peribacillus cavernae TaxID=1674310 RepID=A0A3S1B0Z4_9BACI|nr:hypothetical protein [Peribacillus cavernae]MDQ0221253.1 hypothetical protein [Peribacillus cavernae]RUQ25117.1 hypothetical protein ELQ35_20850 [Peribacillus cavernae]